MGHLDFPPSGIPVVADASVWINLVESGSASKILRALPRAVVITDVALRELESGRAKGRQTIVGVEDLMTQNLLSVIKCPEEVEELFLDLVGGDASDTLDDGEACTLVCAIHLGGAAIIDERKATNLAGRRFPDLRLFSTTDLILQSDVRLSLGEHDIADALFRALTGARMRVPPHRVLEVREILGEERVRLCASLPTWSRLPR